MNSIEFIIIFLLFAMIDPVVYIALRISGSIEKSDNLFIPFYWIYEIFKK